MTCHKSFNIIMNTDNLVYNITEKGEAVTEDFLDTYLIKLLSEALGFTYKLYPRVFLYNTTIDLVIGGTFLEEQYFERALYPHVYTDVTFATLKPNYESGTFTCFNVFSLSVWMSILLSVLLGSCMHCFLFRRTSFVSAFFYTFGILFQKFHEWRPKTKAQKIFVLTWICGIMFITLGYGSALLAFLTFPSREKGIEDFDDLFKALQEGKATVVPRENSGLPLIFPRMNDKRLNYFGAQLQKSDPVSLEDLRKGLKKNVAIVTTRDYLDAILGETDEYFISTDSIYNIYLVLYDLTKTRPKHSCTSEINDVIHRISGSGILQKKYNHDKFQSNLEYIYNNKNNSEDAVQPLSMSHLSGAFYLLLTGYLLGFICLICEICTKRFL